MNFFLNFFAACAFLFAINASGSEADPMRVRIATDATTLDWNRAGNAPSAFLASQLMRGLFQVAVDGSIEADLAESFHQEGRHIRIRVRKGVVWSDGVSLKAQQFVDSWNRILDPHTASPVANYLFDIEGAQEFHQGLKDSRPKIVTHGDYEITIELKRPVQHFKSLFTHPCFYPIRRDLFRNGEWPPVESMAVLGSYRISSRRIDVLTKLEPNLVSLGKGAKPPLPVILRVLDSDTTAQELFRAHELDVVLGVAPTLPHETIGLRSDPVDRVTALVFNSHHASVNDVRLRRAMALALSRDELVKVLGFGREITRNWVSTRLIEREARLDDAGPRIEEAKNLLHQVDRAQLDKPIEFMFPMRDDTKILAEWLQEQWRKNLGLKITLSGREFTAYLADLKSGNFTISLLSWNAGFPSAMNFLEVFHSGGMMDAVFQSADYDRQAEKAEVTLESKDRSKAIRDAQAILVETEVAIAPLYRDVQLALVSPLVAGYHLRSGVLRLDQLRRVP